jgi:hypothetical protein
LDVSLYEHGMGGTLSLVSAIALAISIPGSRRAGRGSDLLTRAVLFTAYVVAGAGFVLWLLTAIL